MNAMTDMPAPLVFTDAVDQPRGSGVHAGT